MDFDIAAKRLQQDQKSAYNRSRASRSARTASAKSKKEAQAARQKAEKRLQQKKIESEHNAQIVDKVVTSIGRVERQLGVANVGSPLVTEKQQQTTSTISTSSSTTSLFTNINPLSNGWSFKATSIHGDGDKIALPPSILETMTSSSNDLDPFGSSSNGGRPIAFRIGILKPDYTFPSSSKMKALIENIKETIVQNEKRKNNVLSSQQSTSSITDNGTANQQDMDDSDDEMDDDGDYSLIVEAYLDELSMKYISYTHGTVVEFTQEDNCVGLPESIARALLQPNSHSLVESSFNDDKEKKIDIPVLRTVDPAASTKTNLTEMNEDDNEYMDVDNKQHTTTEEDDDDGEKTPGHPAYGLFDIPASSVEVTPISRLPAGTNCTFTPTKPSIENGFYSLKDIKVVLEQSLMRTRATLSRGDVIRTWRRGISFDLIVSSLSPAQFGAVSCINTNLNVDFASCENGDTKDEPLAEDVKPEPTGSRILGGGGRLLSEPARPQESKSNETTSSSNSQLIELPPEPDDIKGVCTIQVRGRTPSGTTVTGRRRFACTTSTLSHLFSFASHVCDGADPTMFRLVTRFPRRELQLTTTNENKTLESLDIRQGQESFIVEF